MIAPHLSLMVPETNLPRIVIVGGGFAGLQMAKRLKKAKVQVVMLDRNNYHTFQPLLYQVATAGLEPDSIAGPLRMSFGGQGNYYFRMVKVTGINAEKKEVETMIGNLPYDFLILATGSVTNYFDNSELKNNVLPLKRVVHSLNLRSHILQNFEQAVLTKDEAQLEAMMNLVVVGGGPTGVEICGALAELKKHILPQDYPDLDLSKMDIILIEAADRLLGGMSEASGKQAQEYMRKLGVRVILNKMVDAYDGHEIKVGDEIIPTHTVIWAAGVKGNLVKGIGAEVISKNRIKVDEFNRVIGLEHVYALGDVALMETEEYPEGHPMMAPVAMQQGRHLGSNLLKHLKGKPMKPFKYINKGVMATIGRNKAVVDLPIGLHMKGRAAWFVWMFVHILYLIGFRNKLVTLNNWIWSYFTYDKGTRLIIRTYNRKKKEKAFDQAKQKDDLVTY